MRDIDPPDDQVAAVRSVALDLGRPVVPVYFTSFEIGGQTFCVLVTDDVLEVATRHIKSRRLSLFIDGRASYSCPV